MILLLVLNTNLFQKVKKKIIENLLRIGLKMKKTNGEESHRKIMQEIVKIIQAEKKKTRK